MARTSRTDQAVSLRRVGYATSSSYPTTAKHLRDGREAIRGAIRP